MKDRKDIRYGRLFSKGDVPPVDGIIDQMKEDKSKIPGGLFFIGLHGASNSIDRGISVYQALNDDPEVDAAQAYLELKGVDDQVEEVRRARPGDLDIGSLKHQLSHKMGLARKDFRSVVLDLKDEPGHQEVTEFLDQKDSEFRVEDGYIAVENYPEWEESETSASSSPDIDSLENMLEKEDALREGREYELPPHNEFAVYESSILGIGGHSQELNEFQETVAGVNKSPEQEYGALKERVSNYGKPNPALKLISDFLEEQN